MPFDDRSRAHLEETVSRAMETFRRVREQGPSSPLPAPAGGHAVIAPTAGRGQHAHAAVHGAGVFADPSPAHS